MAQLIAGLPDDIAIECLTRVPFQHFRLATSVCKGWKLEIESPEFFRSRKIAGHSQSVILMAQAKVDETMDCGGSYNGKNPSVPIYRLTFCDLKTGTWGELPPIPGFSNGLPMFCRLALVGLNLVVIGGWDQETSKVSNAVFVFNFVRATWRRGVDMPGVKRSLFGCASDFNHTVYVAGGHDEEKNALRSVLQYDVVKDEWIELPDMAKERDECNVLFHAGKLHVIGGYPTEAQGVFDGSFEALDFYNRQWVQVHENFSRGGLPPKTCVADDHGRLYVCQGGDVAVYRNANWDHGAQLPGDVDDPRCVLMMGQRKPVLAGSAGVGEPHLYQVLDLERSKWMKPEPPKQYSGHVQSFCFLEI